MTKTNMAVLEVACRNMIWPDWFIAVRRLSWPSREGSVVATAQYRWRHIVGEYHRLMQLKARKKGWRNA